MSNDSQSPCTIYTMDTYINLKKRKQETKRRKTTKNIVKTYPQNQQIFQVSTNVVWFFHFKRICNPDFDIVNSFGGFIGLRVWANCSKFLTLLILVLVHFFKFKNLHTQFKTKCNFMYIPHIS